MTRQDAGMHLMLIGLATALFVLQPLADIGVLPVWTPPLVTMATLLAGVMSLGRQRWLASLVAASVLVLAVGLGLRSSSAEGIAGVAGLGLLCLGLLRQVTAEGEVTRARIEGAIALYLMIALVFATAYEMLEAASPGAFTGATGLPQSFRYFSLVVQTSTGFGDIVPASPLARTLATLQAVTGQIFIAVLLARLVSLELAARPPRGGR
ncbi:potassium channel family protein [Falsiroseomonas oryzae]|uniref:potassium channel family protein n=1 Tax=Falsiroseomonas oryzae TaxID=2766473 RepID=UPI0022EAB6C3|nr:potassium channel family protein [Roseomonas sp. MO-31]